MGCIMGKLGRFFVILLTVCSLSVMLPKPAMAGFWGDAWDWVADKVARHLHCIDQPHELLGSMGYGNIVVLALGPLLSKVSSKCWIPVADVLCGIENGISQISGASLLHVRIAISKLS